MPHWGTSNEYHNICFHEEIGKISIFFHLKKSAFSGAVTYTCISFLSSSFYMLRFITLDRMLFLQPKSIDISPQKHMLWYSLVVPCEDRIQLMTGMLHCTELIIIIPSSSQCDLMLKWISFLWILFYLLHLWYTRCLSALTIIALGGWEKEKAEK